MKIKLTFILLLLMSSSTLVFGQWDPIKEFSSHKFPCDTEQSTLEITFCAGNKNEFADSLLNRLYRKILNEIAKDISISSKELKELQIKKIKTSETISDIEILTEEINHYRRIKASIINSQRVWLKLREANSDIISIDCEGGRECNSMTTEADTEEILDRIKKLKTFYYID